jgi:hypothetical protein
LHVIEVCLPLLMPEFFNFTYIIFRNGTAPFSPRCRSRISAFASSSAITPERDALPLELATSHLQSCTRTGYIPSPLTSVNVPTPRKQALVGSKSCVDPGTHLPIANHKLASRFACSNISTCRLYRGRSQVTTTIQQLRSLRITRVLNHARYVHVMSRSNLC